MSNIIGGVFDWIYRSVNANFRYWWIFLLLIIAFTIFVMWPKA